MNALKCQCCGLGLRMDSRYCEACQDAWDLAPERQVANNLLLFDSEREPAYRAFETRHRAETHTANHYTLDGEPLDLEWFLKLNSDPAVEPLSDEDLAAIRSLQPGQELHLGGGAGATFTLRRCLGVL